MRPYLVRAQLSKFDIYVQNLHGLGDSCPVAEIVVQSLFAHLRSAQESGIRNMDQAVSCRTHPEALAKIPTEVAIVAVA